MPLSKRFLSARLAHGREILTGRLPPHWKCRVLGNRDRGFETPLSAFEVAPCGDLFSSCVDTFDKNVAQPSFNSDRSVGNWAFDKIRRVRSDASAP